jgi:hypothetical protein
MHVIDRGADTLRQRDRGAGSGNISAEAGNNGLTGSIEQAGGSGGGSGKLRRRTIDPGMIHQVFLDPRWAPPAAISLFRLAPPHVMLGTGPGMTRASIQYHRMSFNDHI